MKLSGILFFLGMGALYVGERMLLGSGAGRWIGTGLGLLLIAASFALRFQSLATADPSHQRGHRAAMIWSGVSVGALLLYALTTDTAVGLLGLNAEATARWTGAWLAVWPIVWLVGAIPSIMIDRSLRQHPVVLPRGTVRAATLSGVSTALVVSLLFPVNYLARDHDAEWDVAYFRTTRPGDSTLALVRNLADPVEVILFYASANDVKEQLVPYFERLEDESAGSLTLTVVDQPLVPTLAEELKVRENGYVVLRQGEATQKFKVGTDLDRAKRDLKKLDSLVQQHLLELTRGQRIAYLMTGHGEAHPRERENPLRKLRKFKKTLESMKVKVQDFGLTEGSADAVPDDADLVVLMDPTSPLLPEEQAALLTWLHGGGALLVGVEPQSERLTGLLAPLGVEVGEAPLGNESVYAALFRGPMDRHNLATNRFGTHASVKALSRNSSRTGVILPGAVAVREVDADGAATHILIRSMAHTFEDANISFSRDADEPEDTLLLALASTGTGITLPQANALNTPAVPEPTDEPTDGEPADLALAAPFTATAPDLTGPPGDWRVIVIGDTTLWSDPLLEVAPGNQQLLHDMVGWLLGEEEIVGAVSSEEDAKIQHTRDSDVKWFYGTIFLVPLLVLLGGLVFTRVRRRSK